MRPTRTILVGALAAALTLPAAAQAAGTVAGGPVRVAGGQTVSLHAVDGRRDTLTIAIERGTQATGESELLIVTRGVNVSVGRGSATIKGSLGRRGRVDLKLRTTRSLPNRRLPAGCTGSAGRSVRGTLVGLLRLRLADGRTVSIRSLPASAHTGSAIRCEPRDPNRPPGDGGDGEGGDGGDEPRLILSRQDGASMLAFVATPRSLTLTRTAGPRREGKATVNAVSTLRAAGKNLLTVADGGTRATVKAAGRFSGSGLFTATGGAAPFATGPLGGSLRAKLPGQPPTAIAGDDAILISGRS